MNLRVVLADDCFADRWGGERPVGGSGELGKELSFSALCRALAERSGDCERLGSVEESLALCARAGVFRWFLPEAYGGWGWSDRDILRGYLRLSQACLATTFVITQRVAATKRLVACDNPGLQARLLPQLVHAQPMVSVGISHLTTSGQHLGQPLLRATRGGEGWVIDGVSPWVTAAVGCDYFVVGATLIDGDQVLLLVETAAAGVQVEPPLAMMALNASQTGAVRFSEVLVPSEQVLAGPLPHVLQALAVGATGGLQTSALAIGLANAAIESIEQQAVVRPDLAGHGLELRQQSDELTERLLGADSRAVDANELRAAANGLVLRATQAALLVAKGSGFVQGHPVERWCREALFFLVWSCPQVVQQAHLCQMSSPLVEPRCGHDK